METTMTDERTAYPILRESLDESFSAYADHELDALVRQLYGEDVGAEDVEGLFDDIGRGLGRAGRAVGDFAQKAAPAVARTLPSIAQGALAGGGVGGPIGAIVGAAAGGVGGALSQTRNPTLRGIGGALGSATQLVSQFTPAGRLGGLAKAGLGALGSRNPLGGLAQAGLGALGGAMGPAGGALQGLAGQAARFAPQLARGGGASALLGLLSRPETLQALTSSALGAAGRRNVMVGGQPVGIQSLLGALGNLAGRAAGEAESDGEDLPAYFFGQEGELAIDPADSDQRTDALLTFLALTAPRWAAPPAPPPPRSDEFEEAEYTLEHQLADEMLMEMELMEMEDAA
jgi:hypothetical protein